jgi:hypothetical protein
VFLSGGDSFFAVEDFRQIPDRNILQQKWFPVFMRQTSSVCISSVFMRLFLCGVMTGELPPAARCEIILIGTKSFLDVVLA